VLSKNTTWQLKAADYNLGPNYVQYINLIDQFSGEKWEIKYTMDANDQHALMDCTYTPGA